MADITITAANVVKGTGAIVRNGIAGATITAGQNVYKDTGDADKLKLTDADAGSDLVATIDGVALHGATAGQPLAYQDDGPITIGGTVAAGVTYVASDNAGGICPDADATSGSRKSILGVGISTTQIRITRVNSNAAIL